MSLFTDESVITENYNKFMKYINADSRAESLVKMYKNFHNELITAPASSKVYYHSCYPGGYLEHVLRVADTALRVASLYKETGGTIDFTKEELIFSALHHDLGKLGSEDMAYYIDEESDWHRKRGQYYNINENLQYFTVVDRALTTLQRYDIKITEKEWLAIKLSDGMYDASNKPYYTSFSPSAMKTNLPYIIHWADHMSCRTENDKSKFI